MIGCSKLALKRIEYVIQENAFEQKEKIPELKLNHMLALIGLRTTECMSSVINIKYITLYDDLTLPK